MTSFYENSTNSFYCVGYDNTAYRQYMTVRSLVGYGRTWETASYYIQGSEMTDARIGFNLHRGKALLGDIANSQQVNGQYEMVRSVLRGVKVGAAAFKQYHLLGDTGEWIHLFNGYCWPWDGTYLPFPLLAYGGGS